MKWKEKRREEKTEKKIRFRRKGRTDNNDNGYYHCERKRI